MLSLVIFILLNAKKLIRQMSWQIYSQTLFKIDFWEREKASTLTEGPWLEEISAIGRCLYAPWSGAIEVGD